MTTLVVSYSLSGLLVAYLLIRRARAIDPTPLSLSEFGACVALGIAWPVTLMLVFLRWLDET